MIHMKQYRVHEQTGTCLAWWHMPKNSVLGHGDKNWEGLFQHQNKFLFYYFMYLYFICMFCLHVYMLACHVHGSRAWSHFAFLCYFFPALLVSHRLTDICPFMAQSSVLDFLAAVSLLDGLLAFPFSHLTPDSSAGPTYSSCRAISYRAGISTRSPFHSSERLWPCSKPSALTNPAIAPRKPCSGLTPPWSFSTQNILSDNTLHSIFKIWNLIAA